VTFNLHLAFDNLTCLIGDDLIDLSQIIKIFSLLHLRVHYVVLHNLLQSVEKTLVEIDASRIELVWRICFLTLN